MKMHAEVSHFCTLIGANPLLVQGAGGNVSWKEGDTLWVKASGKWLAEADQTDIFVPVDLKHMGKALAASNFDIKPIALTSNGLRPSIETVLHALMPQRIVVHLHAIDALAHLVRSDAKETMVAKMEPTFSGEWVMVDYAKPGVALAQAVATALSKCPGACIVLMQNHGVVLGADDMNGIQALLQRFSSLFRTLSEVTDELADVPSVQPKGLTGYDLVSDRVIQSLALMPSRFSLMNSGWALYPDHVVFLGAKPKIFASFEDWASEGAMISDVAEDLIFVEGVGVYARESFSMAKFVQLKCYADVLSRLPHDVELTCLSSDAVDDLLNWDAEKHRVSLIK